MATIIGLDIGGTNLRIGLVRDRALERSAAFPTSGTLTEGDEIARLGSVIGEFCGIEQIDAVSIGFPSSIGADGKTVLNAPNIVKPDGSHAFSGKNVADPLAEILGVNVLVNKDANHLLYYDAFMAGEADARVAAGEADERVAADKADARSAVKDTDSSGVAGNAGMRTAFEGNLVGCYIGTGFGSAVMVNGRLLRGKHGSAMEAGHIPFFHNDRACGCGMAGCAETYASGRAAREMLETHYPGQSFAQVFRERADEIPVTDLVEAIAVTVATLVNLFDPHRLFLGGGVLSQEFPKNRLTEAILRHTLAPYPREGLDIRFSNHGAYSGVIGAALCAEDEIAARARYTSTI